MQAYKHLLLSPICSSNGQRFPNIYHSVLAPPGPSGQPQPAAGPVLIRRQLVSAVSGVLALVIAVALIEKRRKEEKGRKMVLPNDHAGGGGGGGCCLSALLLQQFAHTGRPFCCTAAAAVSEKMPKRLTR